MGVSESIRFSCLSAALQDFIFIFFLKNVKKRENKQTC